MRRTSRRQFLQQSSAGLAGTLVASPLLWSAPLPKPGEADWLRYGYDLHNTRFNIKEKTLNPGNVDRLKLKWKFDTLDGWPVQNTPAVIGDTLFFGAGAYFYSLDSASGKLNWKFESGLGGPWLNSYAHRGIRSSCEYKDGRIYMAASGLCTVHCLEASTGKEIWKNNIESRNRR